MIGFGVKDLTSGRTSWALASQNADRANALWSYGANTFGFNHGSPGGSGFDSMVFQLDFTSNAGGGLLATDPLRFATGTRIRTARGEVAVEELRVGDRAVTASGASRPIMWIGQRRLGGAGTPLHPGQAPVRVRAGALGQGLPARDLCLSPGHPVLIGADAEGDARAGVPVPVMCLVNGTSIARAPVASVTFWHVELDRHDILLAEGLPVESYYDLGSRPWFAGETGPLHDPDIVPGGGDARCGPVATDGPLIDAARRRIDGVFAAELAAHGAWSGADSSAWLSC